MTRVSFRGLPVPAPLPTHLPTHHDVAPPAATQQLNSQAMYSTIAAASSSSSSFRTVASPTTAWLSKSLSAPTSHTHPDQGEPYHVPETSHRVLEGYTVALIVIGVALFLAGIAACCVKFLGRKHRAWRTTKSTRPVQVITLTPRRTSPTQTPHRDIGLYRVGTTCAPLTDQEDQNARDLENFREYQRRQAEQATRYAYGYGR